MGWYCCELKCFDMTGYDVVDGIACNTCQSFSFCRCKCKTFLKEELYNFCCKHLCSRPNRKEKCLLCGDKLCLCQCKHQTKTSNIKIKINNQFMDVVYIQKSDYCCEKKCFQIPHHLVRGLACQKCKAVNYCKCDCVTWCFEH